MYVLYISLLRNITQINGETQWLLQFCYERAIIHAYKLFEYLLR